MFIYMVDRERLLGNVGEIHLQPSAWGLFLPLTITNLSTVDTRGCSSRSWLASTPRASCSGQEGGNTGITRPLASFRSNTLLWQMADALADCLLSFRLLKVGGIMIVDDETNFPDVALATTAIELALGEGLQILYRKVLFCLR